MSTLIQPIALLAIILTGYLFKRAGKFKNRDYRIMQVALFNLVLPCAIIYSFATNPHDSSMLWISVFGFVVAFIPPVLIFLTTRYTPVLDTRDQSSGNGVAALKNVLNGFEVRKVLQEAVDASRRENGMSAREFLGGPGGPAGPGFGPGPDGPGFDGGFDGPDMGGYADGR